MYMSSIRAAAVVLGGASRAHFEPGKQRHLVFSTIARRACFLIPTNSHFFSKHQFSCCPVPFAMQCNAPHLCPHFRFSKSCSTSKPHFEPGRTLLAVRKFSIRAGNYPTFSTSSVFQKIPSGNQFNRTAPRTLPFSIRAHCPLDSLRGFSSGFFPKSNPFPSLPFLPSQNPLCALQQGGPMFFSFCFFDRIDSIRSASGHFCFAFAFPFPFRS